MKALFINGSPRKNGNTAQLLKRAMDGAREAGAEVELMNLYNRSMNYPILMDTSAKQLAVFGPTEILCSYDTYQFSNYDRYDAATFSEAHKAEVRETQFPIDLEKAYELGKRLVAKAKE
jgi:multimeric flavodoxin WrbA